MTPAQSLKKKEAKKIGSGNLKRSRKQILEKIKDPERRFLNKIKIQQTDLKNEKIRVVRIQIKDQRWKEVEEGGV